MAIACPTLNVTNDAVALAEIRAAGRERLYPSLTNPNWLVLRRRRQIFEQWIACLPGKDLAVLDIGGRIQPYRELLNGRMKRYVAIDLRSTAVVDVNARAEQLPFAHSEFDLVLCTQMLEYAQRPAEVVGEIRRVLKQDGFLLLSVPSLSIRDAEEDAWRFWPASIRQLLAAFSRSEVIREGGSIAGFFRTVNVGVQGLVPHALLRAFLGYTFVPVVNLAGLALENLIPSGNETFVVNYSVLAQK